MGVAEDLIGTELNDLDTLEKIESDLNERKAAASQPVKKSGAGERQVLKIDEILNRSGGFGRYQIFLVLCLGLGGALYVSVQNLSMTFVESSAPWRCVTEQCATNTNSSLEVVHYDVVLLCKSELNGTDWEWVNANHTALSDYNQACGSQTIVTNVLYFCPGVMIGGIMFGMMGWSTGRKTPFLSALLTSMVASVISAASREYILFIILRISLGASIAGYELLYICWIVELVARKWRPLAMGIQGVFGTAGLLIVFYINESWDYWRFKMVYVGIVSLAFIFVYAAVPESPYWLLAQGQDDVSTMVLKRIAVLNGVTFPEVTAAVPSIKTKEKLVAFFQPKYRRTGVWLCVNWLLVGMMYYYIYITLGSYGTPADATPAAHRALTNTNYILALAVELPAALLGAALLVSVLGRKLAYLFHTVVFAACLVVSLIDHEVFPGWDVRRGAILVGVKLTITSAKLVLALWTAELAPTTLRTLLFGAGLAASSCGVVLASSLVFFAASPLTCVIFMLVVTLLALISTTQLHDTSSWDLPDTLFDVYKNMNCGSGDRERGNYSDLQSEGVNTVTIL